MDYSEEMDELYSGENRQMLKKEKIKIKKI